MISLPRRSRFFLDFLVLLSSRSLAQGMTIVVGLLLVRLMPDLIFGAYSLATTSIGLAGIVADFGLDVILTREIASNRQRTRVLIQQTIWLRLGFALVTTLILTGLALLTPTAGRTDLLLLGGLSLTPRGVRRTVTAALTGLGRVREAALIEGIGAVGASVITVILVVARFGWLGDQAVGALWGLALGNAVGMIAALIIGKIDGIGIPNGAVGWRPLAVLAGAAAPLMIVGLAGTAFQSLDIYIVKAFYWRSGAPDAVALYAAPFRILNALLLFPTAWGVVALPRYVRYVRRPRIAALALRRDLRFSLLMGVLLSAGCALLAQPLTALALGPVYVPTVPILVILCWMAVPVCLSAPYIAMLTATHRQSRITVCVVLAGMIAVAANVFLAATGSGRGVIENLSSVAAIKVLSMIALLSFYWVAYRR